MNTTHTQRTPHGCIATVSGGLDSSVALAMVQPLCPVIEAITFDYGQKAASREIQAARELCALYEIPHRVITLDWMKPSGASAPGYLNALMSSKVNLPRPTRSDLDHPEAARASANAVWVPNRNGVFLSIAASIAEAHGINKVCVGFNREEAATFPDNTADYLKALNDCFKYSTRTKVQVVSPTLFMTKDEIVSQALHMGIPLEKIWSCYDGGTSPCGTCESCQRFERARALADRRHGARS